MVIKGRDKTHAYIHTGKKNHLGENRCREKNRGDESINIFWERIKYCNPEVRTRCYENRIFIKIKGAFGS